MGGQFYNATGGQHADQVEEMAIKIPLAGVNPRIVGGEKKNTETRMASRDEMEGSP